MTFRDVAVMIFEFQIRTGHRPTRIHLTHEQRTELLHDLGPDFRHQVRFDGRGEEVLGVELVVSDTTGVT